MAYAQAQGASADHYVQGLVSEALMEANARERKECPTVKPKKSAYGILAQYGPGPSEEEIDENRREMFRGFAEDAP